MRVERSEPYHASRPPIAAPPSDAGTASGIYPPHLAVMDTWRAEAGGRTPLEVGEGDEGQCDKVVGEHHRKVLPRRLQGRKKGDAADVCMYARGCWMWARVFGASLLYSSAHRSQLSRAGKRSASASSLAQGPTAGRWRSTSPLGVATRHVSHCNRRLPMRTSTARVCIGGCRRVGGRGAVGCGTSAHTGGRHRRPNRCISCHKAPLPRGIRARRPVEQCALASQAKIWMMANT